MDTRYREVFICACGHLCMYEADKPSQRTSEAKCCPCYEQQQKRVLGQGERCHIHQMDPSRKIVRKYRRPAKSPGDLEK